MPDTNRTKAALAALYADNVVGDISAQDLRDMLESLFQQAVKGDLLGIGADGLLGRLAATTDGWVLTLDASEDFGWKWAPAGSGGVIFVDAETPAGTIDGANDTFGLDFTPDGLQLFKNGLLMREGSGNDYQISGSTVTFEAAQIPGAGDILLAFYRR